MAPLLAAGIIFEPRRRRPVPPLNLQPENRPPSAPEGTQAVATQVSACGGPRYRAPRKLARRTTFFRSELCCCAIGRQDGNPCRRLRRNRRPWLLHPLRKLHEHQIHSKADALRGL